jgi:integration host factor subunit beta
MIKSQLTRRVAEQNPHLRISDCQNVVNAILGEMEAALARGDRIEIRRFGAFFLRTRSARPGRNPRNGTLVSVPEKLYPAFKTGKEMHHRLNGTAGSDLRATFHKVSGERRGG